MKNDYAMQKLYKGAQHGKCFCGRPLPDRLRGPQWTCGRKPCRKKYLAAYWRQRNTGALRKIERYRQDPSSEHRIILTLECRHRVDRFKSFMERNKTGRVKCAKCLVKN